MTDLIRFTILGLGLGAVYALVAQGVVLIYRGSGLVNFAQGAFAMVGAYAFYETTNLGLHPALGVLISIGVGAVFGFGTQVLVMRQLRSAAPIVRVIATLGIFMAVEAGAALHYGATVQFVEPYLPQFSWSVRDVVLQGDRLTLVAIAVGLTAVLAIAKRRSLVGLATSAAATNERGVAVLGWSPDLLATINWTLGGALAGVAGALIAPLTGLLVLNLSLLIVPALAAALLGRFDSFGLTLVGAMLIGVVQSVLLLYTTQTGAPDAVPFLVIIVVLVITGRGLPLRSHIGERLPSVGSGRIRTVPLVAFATITTFLMIGVFPVSWQDAFAVSFAFAIIMLSIVVVTGYAGQLSLAQFAIAGLGAYVAGRLTATQGWPFWAALLAGVAAAVPIGAVLALPALRTRGVSLAVVTLGLAVVVQRVVFENVDYTGGLAGTHVGRAELFGWDINAITHPGRYGLVVLGALIVALVVVCNLRRSAAGRRLIAIRNNERAAASLGISVVGGKLYAFMVGSAIAALGGVLLAYRSTDIVYGDFSAMKSIHLLAYTVIGGIGYAMGALLGSPLVSGGIGTLFNPLLHSIDVWLIFLGGCAVVVLLILNPNGMVTAHIAQGRWISGKLNGVIARALRRQPSERGMSKRRMDDLLQSQRLDSEPPVRRLELRVEGLSVRYGGVQAVTEVSLTVRPGEIVGLIGPNGAGKTSLIDAISGFISPSHGTVILGDRDVSTLAPHRRLRAGLGRSWQSLELFEDVSVLENLQIACDRRRWFDPIVELLRPRRAVLSATAVDAIRLFERFHLHEDLDRKVSELSFSQQRVLATARAAAAGPSVLLLDEPSAGMSDVRRDELAQVVRGLAERGVSLLIVDHDMPFVLDVCDRIVALDAGRKIADGTPEDVRNDSVVIAAYLRTDESTDGAHVTVREPTDRTLGDGASATSEPVLSARELSVGYNATPVVRGLSLEVHAGEIVALLGANRAGKTTTLLGLAGAIDPLDGAVFWCGTRVSERVPLHERVRQGLGFVPDDRAIFKNLTVDESLRVGRADRTAVADLFPELVPLMKRRVGVLSGGEQQMLALGRALARKPRVLLVDEMSVGLAPMVIARLLDALRHAADESGVGVVLVEQHVQQALRVSDRVCVVAGGRMTLEGYVRDVGDRVEEAFLADVLGRSETTGSVA